MTDYAIPSTQGGFGLIHLVNHAHDVVADESLPRAIGTRRTNLESPRKPCGGFWGESHASTCDIPNDFTRVRPHTPA